MSGKTFRTITSSVSNSDASRVHMSALLSSPIEALGLSLHATQALFKQGFFTVDDFASEYMPKSMAHLIDPTVQTEINDAHQRIINAVYVAFGGE